MMYYSSNVKIIRMGEYMRRNTSNICLCLVGVIALMLAGAASIAGIPIPRPEYPMPQMVRSEWVNLNGQWDFTETDDDNAEFLGNAAYPDKIIVPFVRESKLSGLERKGFIKNVWYRRSFDMPAGWKSPRTLLHIGACDYRTSVWVNGSLVGKHVGGSAPIVMDITPQLKPTGNIVIVHAYDDTRSGLQPEGKQAQSPESQGCVYTRTTGIWQTVWLEGVGSSYIKDYKLDNDPANSRVTLQAEVDGPSTGLTIQAEAYAGNKLVGKASVPADWRNNFVTINLSEKHLWTPSDPFLYDLKLKLMDGSKVVDTLDSYFGLRNVSIEGAAILINGKAIFQRTVLDQGFYPEGVWTAPTDEALKHDIVMSQEAGFNGARLHQKVFDPRYLYWADKLGYMVWGEFPNWGLNTSKTEVNLPYINEWIEVLRRDRNHPAIVGWCPFNETPGDAIPLQNAVVNVTRAIDPSRPVIDSSGWSHGLPDPEVMDAHDYNQNPESFRAKWTGLAPGIMLPARYGSARPRNSMPFFVSEYGGIGWDLSNNGWGYGSAPENLEAFYTRYKGLTDALLDSDHFGYCYTQITDVEQEHNGIYTYDRKPKFDVAKLHAIQTREANYEKNPPLTTPKPAKDDWTVLVGSQVDGELALPWKYTTDKPADNWFATAFDDSKWKTGYGGFGVQEGSTRNPRTVWNTENIWLRREFEAKDTKFKTAIIAIHHDDQAEVYLNGVKILDAGGWNNNYAGLDVTEAVKKAIKPGKNTITVYCHQDAGGQFIDVALLVRK